MINESQIDQMLEIMKNITRQRLPLECGCRTLGRVIDANVLRQKQLCGIEKDSREQYVEDLRWTMFDIQRAASLDSPTRLVRIFYMIVTPYLQLQVVVFFTSKWSSSSLPSGRLLQFQVVVFFGMLHSLLVVQRKLTGTVGLVLWVYPKKNHVQSLVRTHYTESQLIQNWPSFVSSYLPVRQMLRITQLNTGTRSKPQHNWCL